MKKGSRFSGVKGFLAFSAILMMTFALLHSGARAQETAAPPPDQVKELLPDSAATTETAEEKGQEQEMESVDSADSTDSDNGITRGPRVYLDPTMENLSKLYWALGMFNIDKDDIAVNNYIMINECQIYRDFYTDDFEWNSVQSAAREYLRENMKKFPRRFEFIQPIELGRYNEDTQTFEVLSESITKGSRLLYSEMNDRIEICGKRNVIEAYPRNVIVSMSRPLHYPQIPVNSDLARDYIVRAKIRNEEDFRDTSGNLSLDRLKGYQRLAFIVVKVRMIKFMEMRRARTGMFPVVFAALEGVEIYEDPKKKRLLYSSLARTKTEQ